MSVGISRVYRFDECCVCFRRPNEISAGGEFQVIGHLTERAECIHAACLLCIQREDESRARSRPENLSMRQVSMRQACGICRAPLDNDQSDSETVGVQGRLFTVRPVISLGEDGHSVMTPRQDARGMDIPDQFDAVFHVEVINSEDIPSAPASPGVPLNIDDPIDPEQRLAREAELVRRAGMSRIEITCETIGRELLGRVVSLVLCAVAGAAFGMAYEGLFLIARPEEGIFVPREEFNGLSPGFVAMLIIGSVFGIYFGVIGACANPCGDTMGRAGALAGRAIVSGLEGFDGQIERINRAWANLFVDAAQQPVG